MKDYYYINALGISYDEKYSGAIEEYINNGKTTKQEVIHLIAGIHSVETLKECLKYKRILILGYKCLGRGLEKWKHEQDNIIKNFKEWNKEIGSAFNKGALLAFDSLAIRQLGLRFFSNEDWPKVYMGDDGEYTMHLDLVNMTFSASSSFTDRISIGKNSVYDMFQYIRRDQKYRKLHGYCLTLPYPNHLLDCRYYL